MTRTAGQALTARTVTAKTSAASGSTTAIHADPRQTRSSLLRAKRPSRLGSGGLPIDSALRRGGDAPRHAADGCHYWMLRICFTDCATTLDGRGWKLTWDRYDVLFP